MARSFEQSLTDGGIVKKMLIYALPLIGVNLLQALFNTMDIAVLGWFVGTDSVGAVGTTTPLTSLLIGFFIGLSLGANVCVSRCVGEGNREKAERFVGTSIALSLVAGFSLIPIGIFGARHFLEWINCAPELLDSATLYLRIYFLGMPVVMLYNYSASIMRAVGDTFRPLVFLLVGGALNVGLNVIFVALFNMGVAGVAIATVVSNAVSAACCLTVLLKSKGFSKLLLKKLRFFKKEFKTLMYIGVPTGISRVLFSISNVIVQSSINSFGKIVTSASAVANQFDTYIYEINEGFAISMLAFTGQNYGKRDVKRIKKSLGVAIMLMVCFNLVVVSFITLFAAPLCGLITDDAQVIEIAMVKIYIVGGTYILCGIMNSFAYTLRGIGKSVTAMAVGLFGACIFRIFYLKIFITVWNSIVMVYMAYPISWIITILLSMLFLFPALKKLEKKFAEEVAVEASERARQAG